MSYKYAQMLHHEKLKSIKYDNWKFLASGWFFSPPSPSLKNKNLKQDIYEDRLIPSSMDILPLISVVAGHQTIYIVHRIGTHL